MKSSDFSADSPGRLVPTIGGVAAFVPHPLPEEVPLDSTSIVLLGRAEHALGRLVGTTGRLVNPYLVGSPLLHREAILSSRIEGTITTPEQLVLLEATKDLPGSERDIDEDTREVGNYVVAMRRGLKRLKEIPVCLRLIQDIHRDLLDGVRGNADRPGEFRVSQNWIGVRRSDPIQEARYVPPPSKEMTQGLHAFEEYLHQAHPKLPNLVKLALIHYQFEAIHPFRDGNGRIGRLLIPLLLCSQQTMSEPVLYLSSFFERQRDEYVDHLLRVSTRGDWTGWIQFFLTAIESCATESLQKAEGLEALRSKYQRVFHSKRSSALVLKLIDYLFRRPSTTIKRSAKALEVTEAAAAGIIRKLVIARILKKVTPGKRNQVFVAPGILAFMQDAEGQ